VEMEELKKFLHQKLKITPQLQKTGKTKENLQKN
jgi:hypothetical protein